MMHYQSPMLATRFETIQLLVDIGFTQNWLEAYAPGNKFNKIKEWHYEIVPIYA